MAEGPTFEHTMIHMVIEHIFRQPWEQIRLRQVAAGGTERALLEVGNRLLSHDLPALARGDTWGINIPLQLPLRAPRFPELPAS